MKTFLKQFFCEHVWHAYDEKILFYFRWGYYAAAYRSEYGKQKQLAIYMRCLKCGKEKIEETNRSANDL